MHVFRVLWVSISVALAICTGGSPSTTGGGGSTNPDGDGGSGGRIELTQSIDYQDDLMGVSATIKYPGGWFAEGIVEGGTVIVSNDASLVESVAAGADPDVIPENNALLMTFFTPSTVATALGLDAGASLTDFASIVAEQIKPDWGEVGEPGEIMVNGMTLARIEISGPEIDGILLFSRSGEMYIWTVGATHSGTLDTYREVFIAIAAAVEIH